MTGIDGGAQSLDPVTSDAALLGALRARRRHRRQTKHQEPALGVGQKLADRVAASMGSWPFIIIQSVILAGWVTLNILAYTYRWDPYPFILLNLALSFQAAYSAPIIMMSQNRQQDIDRQAVADDYQINVKAELEIESLHEKLDALREIEVLQLTKTVHQLSILLEEAINRVQGRAPPEPHAGR